MCQGDWKENGTHLGLNGDRPVYEWGLSDMADIMKILSTNLAVEGRWRREVVKSGRSFLGRQNRNKVLFAFTDEWDPELHDMLGEKSMDEQAEDEEVGKAW